MPRKASTGLSPKMRIACRANARRWHAKPKEPVQWFATPAGPCRSLTRDDPEWAEIEARYLGRAA